MKTKVLSIIMSVLFTALVLCACGSSGAKAAYKPPAEVFDVKVSGTTEPEIEGVRFAYDGKARIKTVNYSIDEYEYKQEYSYDPDQIVIETFCKTELIEKKVIKYDEIPVTVGYTAVDGYYIRVTEDMPIGASSGGVSDETAAPTEKPTAPPTEKPTNPPTEKPTEDIQKSANRSYYEFLTDHSYWFEDQPRIYSDSVKDSQVAFADINADGISEMLFLRPYNDTGSTIGFCISAYQNGETEIIYDDQLVGIPGQGPSYKIFFDADSVLYSIASNNEIFITRYDVDGDSVSAVLLGEVEATGSSPGDPRYYYVGGNETTSEGFQTLYNEVSESADVYLFAGAIGGGNIESLCMSYDDACEYLSDHS